MNKTLAIYFSNPEILGYPFDKKFFFESYAELSEYFEKYNIKMVIVRGSSYIGNATFNKYSYWDKRNKTYVAINAPIVINLIWNRDSKNTIPLIVDCPILNHHTLDEICRDKLLTFNTFKTISPKTYLIHRFSDLKHILPKIKTDKVVFKPRFGEQSIGVNIESKHDLRKDLYADWTDTLMQEFLDSSIGIPNLVDGLHEINIAMVNGLIAGARIKQPPKGKYISSATGAIIGKTWGIPITQIPEQLLKISNEIDLKFSSFPIRLFRADYVYTKDNGYKLIEINSRPGLMHPLKEGPLYWEFNGTVAKAIINYLQN